MPKHPHHPRRVVWLLQSMAVKSFTSHWQGPVRKHPFDNPFGTQHAAQTPRFVASSFHVKETHYTPIVPELVACLRSTPEASVPNGRCDQRIRSAFLRTHFAVCSLVFPAPPTTAQVVVSITKGHFMCNTLTHPEETAHFSSCRPCGTRSPQQVPASFQCCEDRHH